MMDYRLLEIWITSSGKAITQSQGLYSIWESCASSHCLYVGKAKNIAARIMTLKHPWQIAKQLYTSPCLRYIAIEDDRELSLQECLAIGQLRPAWNFAEKPRIKRTPTNNSWGLKINKTVSNEAWELYNHFFGIDYLKNHAVSMDLIESQYPDSTQHIRQLLDQLKAADLVLEEEDNG